MMHLTFRDLQVSQATYVRLNRGDPTEVGPAADLFRGSSLMVSQVKQEPLELRQEIRPMRLLNDPGNRKRCFLLMLVVWWFDEARITTAEEPRYDPLYSANARDSP